MHHVRERLVVERHLGHEPRVNDNCIVMRKRECQRQVCEVLYFGRFQLVRPAVILGAIVSIVTACYHCFEYSLLVVPPHTQRINLDGQQDGLSALGSFVHQIPHENDLGAWVA
jgi:hypothetical protein